MENFDFNEKSVKEKNVYLLHLDVPRIILLSAVVIGVLILAFLLGMNFSESKVASHTNLPSQELSLDVAQLEKNIEPTPNITHNVLTIPELNSPSTLPKEEVESNTHSQFSPKHEQTELSATRIPDNASQEIINSTHKIKETNTSQKSDNPHKEITEKKKKQKKVVEVAKVLPSSVASSQKNGWSIQIASYTTLTKAQHEAKLLQSQKFDAYVDKAIVSGKTYYRVKVGPISNEEKAIALFKEIQSMDRYKDSYLVKE